MCRMSDMMIEIERLYHEGASVQRIAAELDIPESMVEEAFEELDYMAEYDAGGETDDAYALASIGWGTDEDHGYFGGSDEY